MDITIWKDEGKNFSRPCKTACAEWDHRQSQQLSFLTTWTNGRLFVEVPNCMAIMQECIAFQLIWISLERTADCEICCKREQLN
jgi:hypothetical protein